MSSGLRRFVNAPDPARQQFERCEMCGDVIRDEHSHVVDTEHRSLMCVCRACFLLFTKEGGARYWAVPERYHLDAELTLPEWQGLGIPVSTAFFLRGDSGLAAFYPSPAGATECLLDLDAWTDLAATHPMLLAAKPEVEAILMRELGGRIECYLVPIDACYQLVGTVRVYWKGFDGGQEAKEQIEGVFADIQTKVTPFRPEA